MVARRRACLLLLAGLGCGDDIPSVTFDSTGGRGDDGTTLQSTSASITSGPTAGSRGSESSGGSEASSAGGSGGSGTTGSSGSGESTATTTATTAATDSGSTGSSSDDGTTTVASSGSDSSSGSTGGPPDPVCIDQDLGGALVTVLGDTAVAADDWAPPCASGVGGPDRGHLFTAPVDGFYIFDTLGTVGLDTVLYAYEGSTCGGPVVACNDDATLGVPQSRLSAYLTQDTQRVVIVDGYDDTQAGPYVLDIDAVLGPCHEVDLGSGLPVMAMDDNTGALDKLTGSCVDQPGRDVVFRWEAPLGGAFVIDTVGSGFDTVLHVHDADCGPAELACDDDGAMGLHSEVVVPLVAGQVIHIVVDGYGMDQQGPILLGITAL